MREELTEKDNREDERNGKERKSKERKGKRAGEEMEAAKDKRPK